MTSPFSDTTTANQRPLIEWDEAVRLAKRLGIETAGHPGRWTNLLFVGMHQILDRLEKLE